MMRRLLATLIGVLLVVTVGPTAAARADNTTPAQHVAAAADASLPQPLRPVIFVHGYSGSGAQFDTQARRFASNGYPAAYIDAEEYDSTFATNTTDQVYAALDQKIAGLLKRTGATQVDLLGHSLGTFMSQGYLNSSPARAALVAHYVNLDGATATALPGGVPTLAIWGEGATTRTIAGAKNVYQSNQSHTQTVTSAETFTQAYSFFRGRPPLTTKILPQPPGLVQLSGRAVLFPSNAGVVDARLNVYRISALTGRRLEPRPVASYQLSGDGSFGPFRASGTAHYEFAIVRGTGSSTTTHHLYFEPFIRTDRLIRLLSVTPGQGLDALTEKSAKHVNLIITRNKEWWGDQGADSDTLTVNGVSAIGGTVAPRTKRAIAVFAYDAKNDGVSAPGTPLLPLSNLPFLTAVDLFVPASSPPTGVVSLTSKQRQGDGSTDVINVPNWPSSTDQVSVQFNDFTQSADWPF